MHERTNGGPGGSIGLIAEHFAAHEDVVRLALAEIIPVAEEAGRALVTALQQGHKVIAFGNGGSATQASHFVGELIGRFKRMRRALPALALVSDPGSVTCIANDFGYASLFERQIEALAAPGDVAVGLTTSGTSENVLRGLAAARGAGAVTIALTGRAGLLEGAADHVVRVPSTATAAIQEVHIMLIHAWCGAIDAAL
jgi:D-sedoheptulose 7-phosphate isomerase